MSAKHVHDIGCYYQDAIGAMHLACGIEDQAMPEPLAWSRDWPTEPGWWWFFGERYKGGRRAAELVLVETWRGADSLFFVGNGQFLHKSEVGPHRWAKATLPDVPAAEVEAEMAVAIEAETKGERKP